MLDGDVVVDFAATQFAPTSRLNTKTSFAKFPASPFGILTCYLYCSMISNLAELTLNSKVHAPYLPLEIYMGQNVKVEDHSLSQYEYDVVMEDCENEELLPYSALESSILASSPDLSPIYLDSDFSAFDECYALSTFDEDYYDDSYRNLDAQRTLNVTSASISPLFIGIPSYEELCAQLPWEQQFGALGLEHSTKRLKDEISHLGLEIRATLASLNLSSAYSRAKFRPILQSLPKEFRDESKDKASQATKYRVKKPVLRCNKNAKRIFDYSGIQVCQRVEPGYQLQNHARLPEPELGMNLTQLVTLSDQSDCTINRTRYQRESLDALCFLHPNVTYEPNPHFGIDRPYQQEFTRVELDPATGAHIMATRSALCAYCEDLNFYELKNSAYAQHMSHLHGIYTDDFLAPNPMWMGEYKVAKCLGNKRLTNSRIRNHEGVICPACYQVIEVRCWSSTREKKPLSNYLRHFRKEHRVAKDGKLFFDESYYLH